MASSAARFFGAFADRSFWSFRAIHALTGAILTVLGAASGVFVNEHIKGQISEIDGRIEDAQQRVNDIARVIFQFDFTETNAAELGVMAQSGTLLPDFRKQMTDLMFVTRHTPTLDVLGQTYLTDVKAFTDARQTYEKLLAAARADTAQLSDWNAVLDYEYGAEMKLDAIEGQVQASVAELKDQKRALEGNLDFAIVAGFALQQIGFVVVLLAGLLHQHRTPEHLPLYEIHGHGAEEMH